MFKYFCLCLFIVLSFNLSIAQQPENQKLYRCKINIPEKKSIRGILYSVTDSTIIIAKRSNDVLQFTPDYDTISIKSINNIKLLGVGSGRTGFWIGFLTSVTIGTITAINVDDEVFLGGLESAAYFIWGIILGLPAGGIGALIGSSTWKNYKLQGDSIKFKEYQNEISRKAFIH
jgi:hypothetical protein